MSSFRVSKRTPLHHESIYERDPHMLALRVSPTEHWTMENHGFIYISVYPLVDVSGTTHSGFCFWRRNISHVSNIISLALYLWLSHFLCSISMIHIIPLFLCSIAKIHIIHSISSITITASQYTAMVIHSSFVLLLHHITISRIYSSTEPTAVTWYLD